MSDGETDVGAREDGERNQVTEVGVDLRFRYREGDGRPR
jgi:hypothetical protein